MRIIYSDEAAKTFRKLEKSVQNRIKSYMSDVAILSDPRSRGKALVGNLSGFWRYRIGDYRLICRIQDSELVVVIVKIGHRREVYNNN